MSDDGTMSPDNPMKRYFDLCSEAMDKMGRPPVTKERLQERLENGGLVDITVTRTKQPSLSLNLIKW
jgi:hypothetical protein